MINYPRRGVAKVRCIFNGVTFAYRTVLFLKVSHCAIVVFNYRFSTFVFDLALKYTERVF